MFASRIILNSFLLSLISFVSTTYATDITGRVYGRPMKVDDNVNNNMPTIYDSSSSSTPSTASTTMFFSGDIIPRIVLNGGEYQTFPSKDGTFRFQDIPSGIYLLEIFHRDLVYSTYKINIPSSKENSNTHTNIQIVEYKYPGAPKLPSKYPIEALPVAGAFYFEERPRFSLWSILSSGMMLPMILLLCMFLLPKMVDQDALKQAQEEQQANMGDFDPNNPFASLGSLFNGGGTTGENSDEASSSSTNNQQQRNVRRR